MIDFVFLQPSFYNVLRIPNVVLSEKLNNVWNNDPYQNFRVYYRIEYNSEYNIVTFWIVPKTYTIFIKSQV